MKDLKPWDISPDLSEEHLREVGTVLVRVREQLVQEQRPEEGDNAWSFGCQAYARSCYALRKMSTSDNCPWLRVVQKKEGCYLLFGQESVTFYRGDPDNPPDRAIKRAIRACGWKQLELAINDTNSHQEDDDWFWVLAIESREDGTVLRIVVTQANSNGETRFAWEIPTNQRIASVGIVTNIELEPVNLPAPMVGPKVVEDNESLGEASG